MDPQEPVGGQHGSWEPLEEHRAALAADAVEIARDHPDLALVGLIVDAEAAEASVFRAALEQATGESLEDEEFVGIVPLELVRETLRENQPAVLDAIPASVAADGSRMLPLVAVTKDGFRFGAVAYDPDAE